MLKWKLWQERKEGKKNGQSREEKIKRYVLEINMHIFWVIPEGKKKIQKNRKKSVKVMIQESFCWNRTPESVYLERHTGYKGIDKKGQHQDIS